MPRYDQGNRTFVPALSGDPRSAALLGTHVGETLQAWAPFTLTYSFPVGSAYFVDGQAYGNGEVREGWAPLSTAQQTAVTQALRSWSSVIDLDFVITEDAVNVGDLRFAFTSYNPTGTSEGHSYMPDAGSAVAGDVWVDIAMANKSFAPGSSNYVILLHEIGHAIGLSHPFATAGATRDTAALPDAEDMQAATVMSYTPYLIAGVPTSPMLYDILAAQELYGANWSYDATDTPHRFSNNLSYLETIWDGGGVDTIIVDGTSDIGTFLNLNEGSWSRIGRVNGTSFYDYNIAIAFGTSIENAKLDAGPGLQSDLVLGNFLDNRIELRGGGKVDLEFRHRPTTPNWQHAADFVDGYYGLDTVVIPAPRADYILAPTSLNLGLLTNSAYARVEAKWSPTSDTRPPRTVDAVKGTYYPIAGDHFILSKAAQPGVDRALSTGFFYSIPSDLMGAGIYTRNVERVEFTDSSIAFDLSGNAGIVAKVLGAVFGAAAVHNKEYVGIGLTIADAGTSYESLGTLALNARLGAAAASSDVVKLLYENIVGHAPAADEVAYFTSMLDLGQITRGDLVRLAAETPMNATNIGLVGLAESGLEYI